MATTTLKVNASYADGATRIYTFGPFNASSAKLAALVNDPAGLGGLKNFLKYTVSEDGSAFESVITAQIINADKTEINLN